MRGKIDIDAFLMKGVQTREQTTRIRIFKSNIAQSTPTDVKKRILLYWEQILIMHKNKLFFSLLITLSRKELLDIFLKI